MKQILFFSLIFSCLGGAALAQQENNNRRAIVQERIEAQRIAFITNKLSLTPEESQTFWPLFNQYRGRSKELQNSLNRPIDINNASDIEVEQFIMASLELEEKQIALKREYIQKLKKVLPIRKIAKLTGVERQFNKYILDQVNSSNNKQ